MWLLENLKLSLQIVLYFNWMVLICVLSNPDSNHVKPVLPQISDKKPEILQRKVSSTMSHSREVAEPDENPGSSEPKALSLTA